MTTKVLNYKKDFDNSFNTLKDMGYYYSVKKRDKKTYRELEREIFYDLSEALEYYNKETSKVLTNTGVV